jgi:predicted flap endonuclease-1-like 5' DNA nuclease
MANVTEIEGIGTVYAEKLNPAGITTIADLLKQGATPKGRHNLAEKTGISDKLILRWVNHADLFRIKGVSSQYAELLEAAGVDTVPELAQRNPANLCPAMVQVNQEKKLVRQPPAESQIKDWIEEAKKLPRVVSY